MKEALANNWYYGCPLGRIPLMPIKRDNRSLVLFIILFWYILLNQVLVI